MKQAILAALCSTLLLSLGCDAVEDFGDIEQSAIRINENGHECSASEAREYPYGMAMTLAQYAAHADALSSTSGFTSVGLDNFDPGSVVVVLSDIPTSCDTLPLSDDSLRPSNNLVLFVPPETVDGEANVYASEALISGPNASGEPGGTGIGLPQVAEVEFSASIVDGTICFDDRDDADAFEELGYNPSTEFSVPMCPPS